MNQSTTRRTIIVAAIASPLVAASQGTLAQDSTPAANDVEAIVRAYYEPFNTGDTSIYDTILAEDWADHPLAPGQQPGREGFKPILALYRGIFPDFQVTNEDVIVSGNKVTVRSRAGGTQQAEFLGIPATGKPIEIMTIDIHRVEDEQIAETWHIEDYLSLIYQLGATIQPGLAGTATPTN